MRRQATGYLAVPSTAEPRLLVPVDLPEAYRSLVRHGGGRVARLARAALRAAQRRGVTRWAPLPRLWVERDPRGIEDHLSTALGGPVRIAVLLGPRRANLKPVLQVFDSAGTVVAFVKIATNELTELLLRNEADTLARLGHQAVGGVSVPGLIEFTRWRGRSVLVLSPLPHAQSDLQPTRLPTSQLAAVAAVDGLWVETLGETAFWERVSPQGAGVWLGVDVAPFQRLRDAMDPAGRCTFGAWHGDFGPWNAAVGPAGLEVWDWERFETGVPVGLDAAHWRVQITLRKDMQASDMWLQVRHDVRLVLEAVGADEGTDSLVSGLYLLAIWARYRQDAAQGASTALRSRVGRLGELASEAADSLERSDRTR